MSGMRNANIGVLVGVAILTVGVVLFRTSEAGLQVVTLLAFAGAFGSFIYLESRRLRRSGRR